MQQIKPMTEKQENEFLKRVILSTVAIILLGVLAFCAPEPAMSKANQQEHHVSSEGYSYA